MVNADGSNYKRVTKNDSADHFFPAIAPDGQSVVFSASEGDSYQIREMDLTTGDQRKITDFPNDVFAPTISPDGRLIIFTYNDGSYKTLCGVNRIGSDPHPITSTQQGNQWDATWSPDGSQILFASVIQGIIQLFITDVDG